MWQNILQFFNGDVFGYLLHAFEIAAAEALFAMYLKRRRMFALRAAAALVLLLGLSLVFGVLLGRYAPYFRYLVAFFFSLVLFPLWGTGSTDGICLPGSTVSFSKLFWYASIAAKS